MNTTDIRSNYEAPAIETYSEEELVESIEAYGASFVAP